jgi:hypothetical protein
MNFGPGDIRPGMTPLEVAFTYLGVQETGSNRGPLIDGWHRRMRLEPDPAKNPKVPATGYAWCASFACCCCEDGGRPLPYPSASVQRIWEMNQELVVVPPLEPGDLCLRLIQGQTHIAMFIQEMGWPKWETLDGNSNEAGSREGKDVVRKVRPASHWQGFLRPRHGENR